MKKIGITFLVVLLVVLASVPMTLAKGQQETKEILIGVVYPRSGEGSRLGQTCVNAAELATADINAAGGIQALGGAKIKLIIADTQTDPKVAISQAERLSSSYDITAFNGAYYSGHTIPASEVTERNEIPWVTGSISDKLTDRGYKYIFQVSPKASHFGFMQVETLQELDKEYGVKNDKVGIVYEDTAYGTDTAGGIKEMAEKLGYTVVLYEPYKANFTDADALVSKIKASGAQILFPVSYLTDAILILRTMKRLDCNAVFIGGGAGYIISDFYETLGEDAEYVISVGSWNHDLPYPEVADFAARYEEKYGEFLPEHAGESYIIMWVIKEALEMAGSADPKKVQEALTQLDLSEGSAACMPGRHTQFDATGWNQWVHPVMVQWQNGKLRSIWPKDSAAVDAVWPVPNWSDR
jgi:branched-chain amino acid transport system substrate-binding protein